MLKFEFKKLGKEGYAIKGKVKPCSSKRKVMFYVLSRWIGIEDGSIIIEEVKSECR